MARGQGSGAMVVAGVTPRSASARSRRHRAGTRISMALETGAADGVHLHAVGHLELHAGADHQVQLVARGRARSTP